MISVTDVQSSLAAIQEAAVKGDYEAAHGRQDDLFIEVLEVIANGHPTPAILATEALKALEIKFERYCA